MRVRILMATVLIVLLMAANPLLVGAEVRSLYVSGSVGSMNGSSDDQINYSGTGSRYSNGQSWQSGASTTIAYIQVTGHGWNSDGGWHLVSYPTKSCSNCTYAGTVQTYRCGDLYGYNCQVASYVTHQHYFSDSRFGSRTIYSSHVGNSSSSCHYFRNC